MKNAKAAHWQLFGVELWHRFIGLMAIMLPNLSMKVGN